MKYLKYIPVLVLALFAFNAHASCTAQTKTTDTRNGTVLYNGSCTADNDIVIQTDSLAPYKQCSIMSSTGAVDIDVSVDGTTYSTTVMSVRDQTATTLTNVVVTTALKLYWFDVSFTAIRVRQNGATAAAAALFCR